VDLESFVSGWHGRVYRHIPADSPFGPLEGRLAAGSRFNRWNDAGEPTLYFAGDYGVPIAEFGRHFRELRLFDVGERGRIRRLYEVKLSLKRVFDLRQPAAMLALALSNAPACFLDFTVAQATARFLRHGLGVQAAMVPSMAILDDPARWNLVLFLDRLDGPLDEVVSAVTDAGTFRLDAPNSLPAR
jgi:RES domain-containing protein